MGHIHDVVERWKAKLANFNLDVTIDMLKDTAGHISSLAGSVPALADPTCSSMILREPYGVVLAIAPW